MSRTSHTSFVPTNNKFLIFRKKIEHDRIRKNGDFFLDPHKTSFLKSIC